MTKSTSQIIIVKMLILSSLAFPTFTFALTLGLGNQESGTLTQEAWRALQLQDWTLVEDMTERCIKLYAEQAERMQGRLSVLPNKTIAPTYWALNDVGTCYFIKAQALKMQGQITLARETANIAITQYGYSQCLDPKEGSYWGIADACIDLITTTKMDVNFGDYTSQTLMTKAWMALDALEYDKANVYARKCIALYAEEADKMSKKLNHYAPKEQAFDYWALNDVATCFFIQGEVYKAKQDWNKALNAYQNCFEKYTYGQCWDSGGWFWKPSTVARGRYTEIQEEYLLHKPLQD